MALVKTLLSLGLISTFQTMKNMSEGGDVYFATQLATLINTYLSAATVSSIPMSDIGTIPPNTYTGTSSGVGVTIDVSSLADDLFNTFDKAQSDDDIAKGIAENVNKALSGMKPLTVITTTGTQTAPNGITAPASGTSTDIKFSGASQPTELALKACFLQMAADVSGMGDLTFANALADAIDLSVKAGVVTVTYSVPICVATCMIS